jgi:hypothetical protein
MAVLKSAFWSKTGFSAENPGLRKSEMTLFAHRSEFTPFDVFYRKPVISNLRIAIPVS